MTRYCRPLLAAVLLAALPGRAEDPFTIQTLAVDDRIVQADLADLDGDGLGDLVCVGVDGLPPHESRELRVYFGASDGSFPERPDWSGALPPGSAAYDLAELDEAPGADLVLLRRDRLTRIGWPGRAVRRVDLPFAGGPSIAVTHDERGIDRLALVRLGLGDEPRLLVPGLGWTAVLDRSGAELGRLDVASRANFYLPPRPAPVFSENEAEIYLDHPRIIVGDVNGDGRGDIVAASRHELRIFFQAGDGRFPSRASRSMALGRLSLEDHVRNSGTVRVEGADFDGDDRLDLLISTASGSLFGATTRVTLHLNRDGTWNLDAPDQELVREGGLSGQMVLDLDSDGRVELVDLRVPTGVLEVVEALVTQAIDAEVSIFRTAEGGRFSDEPWHRRKLGLGWSFETFRTLGFVPSVLADLNGDGQNDLLASGNGERLEVYLGDPDAGWPKRHGTQPLDTGGRVRFGDLGTDPLTDFVLYSPRRPGVPLRVGTNRGVLPGSPQETLVSDGDPEDPDGP